MKQELRAPLGELLEDAPDEVAIERVRRRVRVTRRVPSRRRPALLAAAAVALLAAGGAIYATWGPADGPLARADGAPLARLTGPGEVHLSDGSRIALADGATVEVLDNDGARFVAAQGDGRVTYRVRPGGPRRWTIEAGAASVDVVGTVFVVERHGPQVRVAVERGRVRVRGAAVEGGLRTLEPAESVTVGEPLARAEAATDPPGDGAGGTAPASDQTADERTADERTADERTADDQTSDDQTSDERTADDQTADDRPAVVATAPAEGTPAGSSWRRLAARGEHDSAFAALGESGFVAATEGARTVDELLALADTARLSGHATLAVAPLTRIVEGFPTSPRAGVAALSLGRLQLDALDRPAEAARSLQRASELGLPASLRETALARLVEAHHRAGHAALARTYAAAYLAEYPDGRYADEIRRREAR